MLNHEILQEEYKNSKIKYKAKSLEDFQKKLFWFFLILTLTASIIFSSCKSHEKCPAYSNTNTDLMHKS